MIPEEIEDYFLELVDINNVSGNIEIKFERKLVSSARLVVEPRREIIYEIDDENIKPLSFSQDFFESTISLKTRIVDHPAKKIIKDINRYLITIIYKASQDKKLKKIVQTSIRRLSRYYRVLLYEHKKSNTQRNLPETFWSYLTRSNSIVTISFFLENIQEYNEFEEFIKTSDKIKIIK